jgi:hypothetical protein
MSEEQPVHLYKFRSLDGRSAEFTQQIIAGSKLWYSKPMDFNDPFDCSPVISQEVTNKEMKQYYGRLFKRKSSLPRRDRRKMLSESLRDQDRKERPASFLEAVRKSISGAVNSVGVLSLSARCDHVLMWSHYASSHRGICLRFRAQGGSSFSRARKVFYSAERPVLNLIRDTRAEQIDKALLTKADFWSYEQEWRIIDPIRKSGAHSYSMEELDGIIFGARISPSDKEAVIAWVGDRRSEVELLDAAFDSTKFRLVVR